MCCTDTGRAECAVPRSLLELINAFVSLCQDIILALMYESEGDTVGNGMSQFTKTPNTIALCSAANFINAADRVIMPIAIIQMSAQFQWDLHGQGWILSAFSIGYICTMVGIIN